MTTIIRKGLTGALIGAGVGMAATVAVEILKGSIGTEEKPTVEKERKYSNVWDNPDLHPIVDELSAFRETSPAAFEKLLQNLEKFASTLALIMSFSKPTKRNGEKFSEGWAVSAHHYSEDVRESLSAIEFSVSNSSMASMKESFTEKKKELLQFIDNELFNLNMHTQTIIDSGDL